MIGPSSRHGRQAPNLPADIIRRPIPINPGFRLHDLFCMGATFGTLRNRLQPVKVCKNFDNQFPASRRQFGSKGRMRVVSEDGNLPAHEYRATIKFFVHLNDTHPGNGIAGHDGPLDRCCPSPARQKRRMNVEKSAHGRRKDRRGQKCAMVNQDTDFGAQARDFTGEFRIIDRNRKTQFQPEFLRLPGNRSRLHAFAPAGWSRRLRADTRDLMSCGNQRLQCRHSEFTGTDEDQAHDDVFLQSAVRIPPFISAPAFPAFPWQVSF